MDLISYPLFVLPIPADDLGVELSLHVPGYSHDDLAIPFMQKVLS